MIVQAWQAIDALKRIRRDDELRADGLRMVSRWITEHQ